MGVLEVVENTAEEPFIQVKSDKIGSFFDAQSRTTWNLAPGLTGVLFHRYCYARN